MISGAKYLPRPREKIIEKYSDDICHSRWLTFLKELKGENSWKGPIVIPPVAELRSLYYPPEFSRLSTPMPPGVLTPLYKLKQWGGRIKRNFLKPYTL